MKLYITRHGITKDNEAGIIQGHLPGQLSESGLIQAKKLSERLKDINFNAIYSSDLKRAVDTANHISVYHPNTSLHFVEELRERYLGPLQGRRGDSVIRTDYEDHIEPLDSMKERVGSLLNSVYDQNSNENVLFVGHGGINSVLISLLLNKPFEEISKLHNTSLSIYEINGGKNITILENCIEHLK